jgi:hypothetical protein
MEHDLSAMCVGVTEEHLEKTSAVAISSGYRSQKVDAPSEVGGRREPRCQGQRVLVCAECSPTGDQRTQRDNEEYDRHDHPGGGPDCYKQKDDGQEEDDAVEDDQADSDDDGHQHSQYVPEMRQPRFSFARYRPK